MWIGALAQYLVLSVVFLFFLKGVLHIPVSLSVKLWGKSVFVQLCLTSVLYVRGKYLTFPQRTGVNDAVCFMELKCDRHLVVMIWYSIMWMHIFRPIRTAPTDANHRRQSPDYSTSVLRPDKRRFSMFIGRKQTPTDANADPTKRCICCRLSAQCELVFL